MKDWRGTEINPGDTVIYSVSPGSSGSDLLVGEVIELRPKEESDAYCPEDKVKLRVVASNRGGERTRPVHVRAELLTVVALPGVPPGPWCNPKDEEHVVPHKGCALV